MLDAKQTSSKLIHRLLGKSAIILALLLAFPVCAGAGVVVRDGLAVSGKATTLAAQTRGLLLPRGGELVEFRVDGTVLGKNLSGGDGWAYRQFIPKREGLYEVTASSGGEGGSGYLLSVRRGKGVVFIDVQGALFNPPFSREPREGALEALKGIGEMFPLVYLYTELPEAAVRAWLKERGFPPGPLLGWQGGRVFGEAAGKGLAVRAVVGSPEVAGSAKDYTDRLFTFESSEEAREVESWEEVLRTLK
jgi:hypothetical protein